MIIEEDDFKLIPISDSDLKFDLELLYKVQPKGKESRMEFKNVAYGVNLEYALRYIAQYRVTNKHKDESIKLITYLRDYKEELDKLRTLCNF